MSSTHEPVYWDCVGHTLANPGGVGVASTYSITFPQGTTMWRIINGSATHSPEVAGTLATITTAPNPIPIPEVVEGSTWNVYTGSGQTVFIRNRHNGQTINISIMWERIGRQPAMDAGAPVISANLTP